MEQRTPGLKVLIISGEGDTHAHAVAWALRRRGHRPVLWLVTDFPDRQPIMASVGADGRSSIRLADGDIELCDADVVWLRRYVRPCAPDEAHPADRQVIEAESEVFLRGLIEMLPREAFWVNPLHEAMRANFKPIQLAAAAQLGLRIPETCISNDAAAVRGFYDRHRSNDVEVILKTFKQQHWSVNGSMLLLPTTPVREEIFRDDFSISWCPAIYQPRLPKAFEVRATVMGEEVLSLRINSQERKETADDWRVQHAFPVSVAPVELPADIRRKSLALMRKLGIIFGCIDFVVTPEGEYVFLEVNEMGQFLWVEAICPTIPMLDTFAEFLTQRNPAFKRGDTMGRTRYASYVSDEGGAAELARESAKHRKYVPERRTVEA